MEALNGFSHVYLPDSLNPISLYQGYVLESSKSKQNIHSKDRWENEESLIAQVQLMGQSVVKFFQWTSPTLMFDTLEFKSILDTSCIQVISPFLHSIPSSVN